MQHEATYNEALAQAVGIRRELNETHWAEMSRLNKEFAEKTGLKDGEFGVAKDMLYYVGGYPSESTPPRMQSVVLNFLKMCKILRYLGKDNELKQYLAEAGLKVEFTPIDDAATPEVQNIINQALDVQSTICELSDQIKLDIAEAVKETCGILPTYFLLNVDVEAKKLGGSNVEKKVDQIKQQSTCLNEIIAKIDQNKVED